MTESLLHKGESQLIFLAKKLICIGEKSVPQTACLSSKVKKYTAELSFGSSRNTLSRRAQMSPQSSFSISLNFYQTILESSPQTTFMFDIKKLFLVDALTFITGQTQDDPLRIAIDLPEFRRIPKRRYKCRVRPATPCVTPQLSFLLFRFVAFHYDMKVIYCGVLFPRRF